MVSKTRQLTPAWMQSLQPHLKEHYRQQTSFGMEELHQLSDQESTIAKRQTLSINNVVSGMYPNYKVKDPGIRGPGEPPIPKG